MFRALKEYATAGIEALGNGNGLDAFDIVMGYPDPAMKAFPSELTKTIIHFEIDDITDVPFGFGQNIVQEDIEGDGNTTPYSTTYSEAMCKVVNFDVGIWSSYQSGGVTSRMVAYQALNSLFSGASAYQTFQEASGGLEIRSFSGGRFLPDHINDIPVFRVVGGELVIRAYVRRTFGPYTGIDTIIQDPTFHIDSQTTKG
jgi:hypothetical protein